jgi:nitroimidazol reductase NimA-like FMN-containing flavoprotein (pyridoxamine 5'-phosphate oxidase superfamily)
MPAPMTSEECQEFLAGPHVGIVSVNQPGRGPMSVPIWYFYEPGGDVVLITPPDSRKGKLMQVGVRIGFCVQTEDLPPKYVSVEGPVVSIEPADVERHVRPLCHRYLGQEIGDGYVDSTRPDGTTKEVVIRMRPDRWYSRDFAKQAAA